MLQRPSPECFIEYGNSTDPVDGKGVSTVSSKCRHEVDGYFDKADKSSHLFEASVGYFAGYFVVMPVLLWLLLRKWFQPYAIAVRRVTGGALSANGAMLLLCVAPPTVAMYAIQQAFNRLPREA